MAMILAVLLLFLFTELNGFTIKSQHGRFVLKSTWQEDLDKFLDVDTECSSRRDIASDLLQKAGDISADVTTAIQNKDVKKVAPPSLKYGKAVVGIQAVQRQIVNDILPDFLSKSVPKIVESGPKVASELFKSAPSTIKDVFSAIKDIAGDASALQATVEDLRNEAKNIISSTPVGLYTPAYTVLKKTDQYEVRKYSQYGVCSTSIPASESESEVAGPLESGTGFSVLASYIFGKNAQEKRMSMTTPVIMRAGKMEFVLPSGMTSAEAPAPTSTDIELQDVAAETVAVLEFPGLATDGEVSRQRALLEDALLGDGIFYDNLSFKLFQYNPPYTLPWLRRNEVSLGVDFVADSELSNTVASDAEFVSNDESTFFSAPEAGD